MCVPMHVHENKHRSAEPGGPTFRPKAKEMGTTAFPYMVDPNTKTSMPESDDIVKYLFETYGEGAQVDTCFSRAFCPN